MNEDEDSFLFADSISGLELAMREACVACGWDLVKNPMVRVVLSINDEDTLVYLLSYFYGDGEWWNRERR